MQTIIEVMRELIGEPDFYLESSSGYSGSWDYGAMIEYFFAGLILIITIATVFKLLVNWSK